MMSAILASMTTREAGRLAFKTKGHALVTPDVIKSTEHIIS